MKKSLRNLMVGAALPLPLLIAACDNNKKPTPMPTPTPTPTPATFQGKISAAFAAIFNASANSDPKEPATTDVPALNLTADPVDN